MFTPRVSNEHTTRLINALLALSTTENASRFLEDVLTVQELNSISQRVSVAHLLLNKTKYSDIVKETGASTATISRVNRCLQYGANGYQLALCSTPQSDSITENEE